MFESCAPAVVADGGDRSRRCATARCVHDLHQSLGRHRLSCSLPQTPGLSAVAQCTPFAGFVVRPPTETAPRMAAKMRSVSSSTGGFFGGTASMNWTLNAAPVMRLGRSELACKTFSGASPASTARLENGLDRRSKFFPAAVEPSGNPLVRAHLGHERRHCGTSRRLAQILEAPFDQGPKIGAEFSGGSRKAFARFVTPDDGCGNEFGLRGPTSGDRSDVDVAPPRHLLDAEGVVAAFGQKFPHSLEDEVVEGGVAWSAYRSPLHRHWLGRRSHSSSLSGDPTN